MKAVVTAIHRSEDRTSWDVRLHEVNEADEASELEPTVPEADLESLGLVELDWDEFVPIETVEPWHWRDDVKIDLHAGLTDPASAERLAERVTPLLRKIGRTQEIAFEAEEEDDGSFAAVIWVYPRAGTFVEYFGDLVAAGPDSGWRRDPESDYAAVEWRAELADEGASFLDPAVRSARLLCRCWTSPAAVEPDERILRL